MTRYTFHRRCWKWLPFCCTQRFARLKSLSATLWRTFLRCSFENPFTPLISSSTIVGFAELTSFWAFYVGKHMLVGILQCAFFVSGYFMWGFFRSPLTPISTMVYPIIVRWTRVCTHNVQILMCKDICICCLSQF